MNFRKAASTLCWCSASFLALGMYLFVLASIEVGTAYDGSPGRILFLVLSGGALVVMISLIALAYSIERSPRATPAALSNGREQG